MKEFVLQTKDNGNLVIGIRLLFFDNSMIDEPIANLKNYSIRLFSNIEFDVWAIQAIDDQPYIIMNKKSVDEIFDILGEL